VDFRHLGLPVSDVNRSLRFYATYFGFDLALRETTEITVPDGFLHFGFAMPAAAAVRTLGDRMESDHVLIQSWWYRMLITFPSGARTKNRRTPHASVVSGCTIS
jgi:catechol 2,3-dioxygenase-like lactoylglutathione lyase family enzyme